jgi:hypothetical protein
MIIFYHLYIKNAIAWQKFIGFISLTVQSFLPNDKNLTFFKNTIEIGDLI